MCLQNVNKLPVRAEWKTKALSMLFERRFEFPNISRVSDRDTGGFISHPLRIISIPPKRF